MAWSCDEEDEDEYAYALADDDEEDIANLTSIATSNDTPLRKDAFARSFRGDKYEEEECEDDEGECGDAVTDDISTSQASTSSVDPKDGGVGTAAASSSTDLKARACDTDIFPGFKKKERVLIPVNLVLDPNVDTNPFGITQAIKYDLKLPDVFPTLVNFQGDRNAVFLIVLDGPSEQDAVWDPPTLDCKGTTHNAFRKIIDEFYTETFTGRSDPATYSTAVVSLSLGYHGNKFRRDPNAIEIGASASHFRNLVLNMPNLRMVYTMGKYAEEFFVHNLDAHQMYGLDPLQPFHRNHLPSPTMNARKSHGEYGNAYIGGQLSFRYCPLPWIGHTDFRKMLTSSLFRIEDTEQPLRTFPVDPNPYDISQPPLLIQHNQSPEYHDFDSFKRHMHRELKKASPQIGNESSLCSEFGDEFEFEDQCPDDSAQAAPTPSPVDLFVNAANEPYLINQIGGGGNPYHVYVRDTNYDNINNVMNLYCSTPSSTPLMVSVRNPIFSFHISPHFSFGGAHGYWEHDSNNLKDVHLNFLRATVNQKLFYRFNDLLPLECTNRHVKFELETGKHDDTEGYWHNKTFKYIRVDVPHYMLIECVLTQLKKLVEDQNKKAEKFKVFGLDNAERMFAVKYQVFMSTWHSVSKLAIQPPSSVAPYEGTTHARLLYSNMDFDAPGSTIKFLLPENQIPIGNYLNGDGTQMTSSDTPTDIREAYDIETWFEKSAGKDIDNTPIVCICVTVRKHDPLVTKFDKNTHTPLNGYYTYTFVMGKIAPRSLGSDEEIVETLGPEFVFEFYREDHLISSYFYFKHLLMAAYSQGHNSKGFDERKIFARARMINAEITPTGWRMDQQTRLTIKKFQSAAKGERKLYFAEGQEGVCHVDTLQVAMNELNRGTYKLGALAQEFVGMTKHDMPYDAIKGHWAEGPASRRTLVDYCIRDAQLPDQINTRRQTIAAQNEIARTVTTITEGRLQDEGMQVKVMGALKYTNMKFGNEVLLPTSKWWMKRYNEGVGSGGSAAGYKTKEVSKMMGEMYLGDKKPGEKDEEEEVVYTRIPVGPKKPACLTDLKGFFKPDNDAPKLYKPGAGLKKTDNRSFKAKRAEVDSALAASRAATSAKRKAEYEGAIVIKTHKGWYRAAPPICLDAASLYPSTAIANNTSRNTKVFEDEMEMRGVTKDMCLEPAPGLFVTNPNTGRKVRAYFIKKEYRIGLLTRTEQDLLIRRSIAKKLIEFYGNEFLEDGVTPNPHLNKILAEIALHRSNSLKLVANSGYGLYGTSSENGDRHCAASITAWGRHYITIVKALGESMGGYTVGGDTDSVFMAFMSYLNTKDAERFAIDVLMPAINERMPPEVRFEFEKTMKYFVAVAKKRYIYWLCALGKVPKLSFKGLEIVRRDSLPFTKDTMLKALHILQELPDHDLTPEEDAAWVKVRKAKAIDLIRKAATTLLSGQLSIDQLLLSKSLSREYYTNLNQEHLAVARKLSERGLPTPTVGDRVYFVYTITPSPPGLKGDQKGYIIADDPEYVARNSVPIDYKYYFNHKFLTPIGSIMSHFLLEDMSARICARNPKKTEVTMKEVTAETKHFLFGDITSSFKKNTATKNITKTAGTKPITTFASSSVVSSKKTEEQLLAQAKAFCSQGQGKAAAAVVAKPDATNAKSIAFFAEPSKLVSTTYRRPRAHVQLEYDEMHTKFSAELTLKTATMDEIHVGCRNVCKFPKDKKVECKNVDCKRFWPRIEAEAVVDQLASKIARINKEIGEAAKLLSIDDADLVGSNSLFDSYVPRPAPPPKRQRRRK